jgi:pimeloyl-ACP methyl ester carboxylesterase
MVIPAFLTGDWATAPFRRFLQACGFRAVGWGLGINWGPTPRILNGLRRQLGSLRDLHGGPICLVGISLGGLLARDLAHSRPGDVRQVITLASPYRLPTAATIEPLFHFMGRFYSHDIDLVRLARPLTMPELNIFTRDDGIVAWQTCRPDHAPRESWVAHEVRGAHLTICRNPQAMAAVVRRLTAPHHQ